MLFCFIGIKENEEKPTTDTDRDLIAQSDRQEVISKEDSKSDKIENFDVNSYIYFYSEK